MSATELRPTPTCPNPAPHAPHSRGGWPRPAPQFECPGVPDHLLLRGVLPDGQDVLVRVWDPDGMIRSATPGGIIGEVATRPSQCAWQTWSPPAELYEEPS